MGQCTMTDYPKYSKPEATQEVDDTKAETKEEK